MNNNHKEKLTMSQYFDIGLEKGALLMDASNLDWFTFPLFSCIRREIYRTLEDPDEDMDWGYSYPGGKTKLRELIASHESVIEGETINKDEVIVGGNGTTGALNFVAQVIAREYKFADDIEIIYPVPAYAGLKKSLTFYGIKTNVISMDKSNDYKMRYEDVVKGYTDKTVALLITNPANPACKFIDEDELEKIVNFCIEKDIYIIYDAIFEEAPLFKDKRVQIFKLANDYKKLIKIKGFSKDIPQLSDLRCGWTICKDPKIINWLLELGEAVNYSNSTFLEALGIVEMTQRVNVDSGDKSPETLEYIKEKEEYHNQIFTLFNDAYDYLMSQTDVVENVVYPDAGNIMYITFKSGVCRKKGVYTSHELFVYILEKENILVTPGNVFGLPLEDISFRVTISRGYDQFMDGLKRIVELFKEECPNDK